MKKVIKVTLIILIALCFTSTFSSTIYAAQPQITVKINDNKLVFPDAQPFVDAKGRTQTPAKYIGEALGASVTWNSRAKKAEFIFGDTELVLYIGKSSYEVNGQIKMMDTSAIIKDGRTFVPAKYIAEALGADVKWDGATKTVYLNRTLTTQVEEGKDIEDGSVINNQAEFLEALRLASVTLQPTLYLRCNNYDNSDYDFKNFDNTDVSQFGAKNISLNWSFYKGVADLTVDINYTQRHRIQQSLANNIALDRLSVEDIEIVDKIEKIISEIIRDGMTDYEKELAIHDYLVRNYKYDIDNYENGTLPDESFTPYGLLIKGTGVCQAYADTMKLLLNKAGIECEVVVGTSRDENHAWNIVKLEDEYYMIDATWNDPTPDEEGYAYYDYFNLTSERMAEDHSWDTSKWPVANGTKYNYFIYNNLVVNNYMEFQNLIKKSMSEGKKDIVMYINGYNKGAFDLNFIFNFYSHNSISYNVEDKENTVFRLILK